MERYRRKPEPPSTDLLLASQYTPGQPLDDLRKVAEQAYGGEVAECDLPSGAVLLAKYTYVPDEAPSRPDYAIVRAGEYLTWSEKYDSLGTDTRRGIDQWYDPAPAASSSPGHP